ncbi:MAG: phosphatase PAP2 family protein [Bacteroidota bacterium]|nr:phosphatase PAP2 family protein [Bacteroidota bacterium]
MRNIIKCCLTALCFCVALLTPGSSKAQNWDIDLLKQINPSQPGSSVWKGFSSTAKPISVGLPAVMLATAMLNKDSLLKSRSLEILGSVVLTTVATEAIKIVVNRERPYRKYPLEVFPNDASENGKSMPSAHVSLAFATATSLSLVYHKWYVTVPAFVWASGVGYSRLYLGEHYPSDVIAGAAVGISGAYANRWLQKKLWPDHKKRLIPR